MARTKAELPIVSSADADTLPPLADLSAPAGTPEGVAAAWADVVPSIAKQVALCFNDRPILLQLATCVWMRNKALGELEGEPLKSVTANGAFQINPLVKIIHTLDQQILKLSQRFGLDPASRQRMKIDDAGKRKKENKFSKLLERQRTPVPKE